MCPYSYYKPLLIIVSAMISKLLYSFISVILPTITLGILISCIRTIHWTVTNDYLTLNMQNAILFYFSTTVLKDVVSVSVITGICIIWILILFWLVYSFFNKRSTDPLKSSRTFALLLAASTALVSLLIIGYNTNLGKLSILFSADRIVFNGGLVLGAFLLFLGLKFIIWSSLFQRLIDSVGKAIVAKITLITTGIVVIAVSILTFFISPMRANQISAGKSNVILLVVDAWRSDCLGANNPVCRFTPNINAFASESVVFLNATAQGPNTINSSPAILCSVYPGEHGYTDYTRKTSSKLLSLAEVLLNQGYRTYGFSTNPHVSARNGLAQGFQVFVEDGSWKNTPAQEVNRRFLLWAEENTASPFFAMLWYIDPHNPYDPPENHQKQFVNSELRHLISDSTKNPLNHRLTAIEREVSQQLYNASVHYFDAEFGNLISRMKEIGLYDSTLIILTSDHGEAFWEYENPLGEPIYGHGFSLRSQETAIPLIIKFPGYHYTSRIESRVSSIDIVPTTIDFLELENAHRFEPYHRGVSLMGSVQADSDYQPEPYTFSELITQQYGPYLLRSVHDDNHKLILTFQYKESIFDPPLEQLFELSDGEKEISLDSEGEVQAIRQRLLEQLNYWQQELHPFQSISSKISAGEEEALQERLRSLGYID